MEEPYGCEGEIAAVSFLFCFVLCVFPKMAEPSLLIHFVGLLFFSFQMHAGIAEVAAAKARMFINKPDGST